MMSRWSDFTVGIKLLCFDLDGTIYRGSELIPQVKELLEELSKKFRIVYFTNGSVKSKASIRKKLSNLGINCTIDEVYSSSSLVSEYLKENQLNKIFLIGSEEFKQELLNQKIEVVPYEQADHVVVGMDPGLNFKKITEAMRVLRRGGKFVVCNEDESFPISETEHLPGCGAMVGAIKGCVDKSPDFMIGKPNTYILSKICKAVGVSHAEVVVIGDSYGSDIQMAKNFNCRSILVNSMDDPSGFSHDEFFWNLDSVDNLLAEVRRAS